MGARKRLLAELSAGRLTAEIDDVEVPAEYWTCNGADTTAHTGLLQPPEINAWAYAKLANQPCFIERGAFEKWLSEIHGRRGRKPGDGAYDDSACMDEMARLLKAGEAKTVNDAARIVAPGAGGYGLVESRQKRLVRHWKQHRD